MKLKPYPHQLSGAEHLAGRKVAGLFDQQRVGKNLSTIIAADKIKARKILYISTVSGGPVAYQAFFQNQTILRTIQIMKPKDKITGDLVIVSWASINNSEMRAKLLAQHWDLIVVDESHYAKSFTAKRTRSLYGQPQLDGKGLDQSKALVVRAERCWLLTGTPLPHDLSDIYPALRALAPELLLAHAGMPDVTTISRFESQYTIMKPVKVSPWTTKWVKVGGRNEHELKRRLSGDKFMLRRTQADVGILPARYVMRPLVSDEAELILMAGMSREEVQAVLDSRRYDDVRLTRLMHLHGIAKARAVVEAISEEFDCGLERVVLGYWHRDVGDILRAGLSKYHVVGIDGQTPPAHREGIVKAFHNGAPKVFLQQLAAAGESIDLSASSLLWFVESVFSPSTMQQAANRVVNARNATAPVVETCFIDGTIDEVIQGRLLSLWSAINKVVTA